MLIPESQNPAVPWHSSAAQRVVKTGVANCWAGRVTSAGGLLPLCLFSRLPDRGNKLSLARGEVMRIRRDSLYEMFIMAPTHSESTVN